MNAQSQLFACNAPSVLGLVALIAAHKKTEKEFLIQISEKLIKIYGYEPFIALMQQHKNIRFTLDHAYDLDILRQCKAEDGWYSALFDGANKTTTLEENIAISKQAKEICRANGVLYEGEVGVLNKGTITPIEDIQRFLDEVQPDMLGFSVGSAHGANVGNNINTEIVARVRKIADIPLVIHGGSGIGLEALQELFAAGANKINISTCFKKQFSRIIGEQKVFDAPKAMPELITAFSQELQLREVQ